LTFFKKKKTDEARALQSMGFTGSESAHRDHPRGLLKKEEQLG
jgi:hypothetical protein